MQSSVVRAASVVAFGSVALAGCAAFGTGTSQSTGVSRVSRYGTEAEVLATVVEVKRTGRAQNISNRAVRLPVQEFYPMTRFDYELPAACGGYAFRVYESGTTQILEYTLVGADGTELSIRDYVAGTNPFIKPGLWTALDHTADSVSFMMTDFAETKSLIIPEVYSKGLVTGLPEMLKRDLGAEYRRAVHAAAACDQPLVAGR
ncbi:MAG TPA: hypothetical protein VFX89_03260 [Gammaproteobacteria bacterium]|nr:hypothetical protein [Gammaproteobacteria bacterium]